MALRKRGRKISFPPDAAAAALWKQWQTFAGLFTCNKWKQTLCLVFPDPGESNAERGHKARVAASSELLVEQKQDEPSVEEKKGFWALILFTVTSNKKYSFKIIL